MITTADPRTGVRSDTDRTASTPTEVDALAAAAAVAAVEADRE